MMAAMCMVLSSGPVFAQELTAPAEDSTQTEYEQTPVPETAQSESVQEPETETQAPETETAETETESEKTPESQKESSSAAQTKSTGAEQENKAQKEKAQKEADKKDTATDAGVEISDADPQPGVMDFVRSGTAVPIKGLPSFITQEMVSGILDLQDRTSFPASVSMAQLILDSRSGDGLNDIAFRQHNLYAMRGKDGSYKTYQTDAQSIRDYGDWLKAHCTDLSGMKDSIKLYVHAYAQRRSDEKDYELRLLKVMKQYDLFRLDHMKLSDFEALLPSWVNPCPGSHVTSTFGWRAIFGRTHLGIDLATNSRNIASYAAAGGTVTYTGYGPSSGNMIVIDHGNGYVTKYMHHYKMYVKAGDHVYKGQQIGLTGTTGHSTGIHLHFQVEVNGKAVNPEPYLHNDAQGSAVAVNTKDESTEPLVSVKPGWDIPGVIRIGDLKPRKEYVILKNAALNTDQTQLLP